MNKKLRILLCSLLAVATIFSFAFAGCEEPIDDTSSSSSSTTSTDDTATTNTDTADDSTGSTTSDHTTHEYDYTNAEVKWGTDYKSAVITVPCTGCDETTSYTITDISISSVVKTSATKVSTGVSTYTASFSYEGTTYTSPSWDAETPATATVYDAYYIDELTETGAITAGTSLFDGFATTAGPVYWYNNSSETPETDNIVDGYTFQGRLNVSYGVSSGSGSLTFTLANDATVTLYAMITANEAVAPTLTDSTGSVSKTIVASSSANANIVCPYEYDLSAGTYTITNPSSSGKCVIYAIALEGTGYNAGIWNYSEPTEELEDNQFKLVADTEYTFTATEAGYYTFSVPETSSVTIWKSEADYNADASDTSITPYLDGGTSFEVYIEKDASITMYCVDSVIVTYTYSETSGGAATTITTSVPSSLTTGNNSISLSAGDADTGLSATFTVETAGTYVFSTTSSDAYMTVGAAYVRGSGNTEITSSNSYTTAELSEGDTVTIYFYTYDFETAATYTLNIATASTSETVVPTSLNVGGDTVATLDAASDTDYYYYISADVETAGYYTFTLSGTDLTYVEVTVYDRDGSWTSDSTLTASSTSVTLLYGVGDTIKVYGSLASGATGEITFTLNTVKKSTALTTSVPESLVLDTAYSTEGNTIVLSSSDGSDNVERTFTATEAGIYTFSIDSGSDSDIDIGSSNINYMPNYGHGTLSASLYLAANEEVTISFGAWNGSEAVYSFHITYAETTGDTLTVGEATTLTMYSTTATYGYVAFVTYTAKADGSYYIALGSSSSTWTSYHTVTLTSGETTLAGNDYCYNLTVTAGNTYTVMIAYSGYSMTSYYTYSATLTSGSVTVVETSVADLEIKENSITLSTADGKGGVVKTFKAETAGLYTFSIPADSTASVAVGSTTLKGTTTSVSYILAANQELSITFKTSDSLSGSYTLTIANPSVTYQELTPETALTLTKYTNGLSYSYTISYAYATYTATSDTAGKSYYISLTSSSTISATTTLYVNGTAVELTNGNYNFTMGSADTEYKFEIVYSGATISTYTKLYATLVGGTYTPKTTSINTGTESSGSLVSGANAVVLSSSDASDGYVISTFAASKDGIYTFTVNKDEDADVYIANSESDYNSYNYSNIYSSNTEASFLLSQGDTLYIILKTNSGSEGEYTLTITISDITKVALSTSSDATLTLIDLGSYSYAAYATFTATEDTAGNYYITISSTDSWFDTSYVTSVTINGDTASGESLSFNTPMVEGTNTVIINFYDYYFDDTATYTVSLTSGSIKIIETSLPTSLSTTAANEVSISASDAQAYWYSMPTATYTLAAGTYTLSITSGTDAYVYCFTSDYETVYGGVYYYTDYGYGTTEYEFELTEETTLTFKFSTGSGNSATYVFYLTKDGEEQESGGGSSEVTTSIVPTSLEIGGNTATIIADDGKKGSTGGPYTLDAGDYTLSITEGSNAYAIVSVYDNDDDKNTLYYFTLSDDDKLTYDITIASGNVIYIVFSTYDEGAGSYSITLGKKVTTTIASVDFTSYTSNTLSTTADAEWEDLLLDDEDSTDTGFDVIGKISSGSETVATIEKKNKVMCLVFGGTASDTSSALRYYLEAGTYTVTVSYFNGNAGRYAVVKGGYDSNGNLITLSDDVTNDELTTTDNAVVTRTMEITVSEDGYIYIGSASSGLYITAVTITQTTTVTTAE